VGIELISYFGDWPQTEKKAIAGAGFYRLLIYHISGVVLAPNKIIYPIIIYHKVINI